MHDVIEIDRANTKPQPELAKPGQTVGGAIPDTKAKELLSRQPPIERANGATEPRATTRAQTHSPPPGIARKPMADCGGEPNQAGHSPCDTPQIFAILPGDQRVPVAGEPIAAAQHGAVTPKEVSGGDILPQLVEQWRRRQDMLRARQRLELQAQAVCRRVVDGDKLAAAKLWGEVKADPMHELRGWLGPFIAAIAPLDSAKHEMEKALVKLVKQTPVYEWAQGIRGLGDVSLAAILGECAIGPGEYKSVSALWKRMGLAVIDGGRQRRVLGAAALDHGYNAERRSLMWNISASLIKAQLRSEKGEDGKKVEGSGYSLGELGQVYIDRKAYQNERNAERDEPWTPAHIHNDAARFMAKRLLRMLWQVWRQAVPHAVPKELSPAANTIQGAIIKAKPTFAPPPETNSRRAKSIASHNGTVPGGEP